MQQVLNQLGYLHGNLLTAFGRTSDRKNGLHDRLLLAFHSNSEHEHFNDGEEEESREQEFRGAVGFVASKLVAMMTLFNRRQDRHYAEWEREEHQHCKHIIAELEGVHVFIPEPEVE